MGSDPTAPYVAPSLHVPLDRSAFAQPAIMSSKNSIDAAKFVDRSTLSSTDCPVPKCRLGYEYMPFGDVDACVK